MLPRPARCGAGKSTVARRMGHLFAGLGMLSKTQVVIKSPSQMQTGYVGQAGNKTREIMREARGGVLLIGATPPLPEPAVQAARMHREGLLMQRPTTPEHACAQTRHTPS